MKEKLVGILICMLMVSSVFASAADINREPDVNSTNISTNIEDNSITLVSTPVHKDLKTSNVREKKMMSLSLFGFDLEANEVYLSSQPSDWYKEHVVTDPHAGDELYIHWVYTIWGSGTVDPFYWRIWLYVQGGGDVIDHEYHVTDPEFRQAGYIYKWCFEDPWVAPGGDYTLTLEVDSHDDIDEDDEDNNIVSMDFSMTPTNQKFDMEANDVWLSSQPNDWEKEYEIDPNNPIDADTEIFFYFQWTIWGNPETLVDPYCINITLDGPGGFAFEAFIEDPAYREAGYIITIYLQDEEGNGWFAVGGDYTLTCIVDSQDNVNEWNENNNEKSVSFSVVPPFYFIHLTDTHVGTTGGKERFEEMVNYINGLDPSPAFVVISGDLVHWGGGWVGENHYQLFNNVVSNLEVPYFTCPGNHDYFGTIDNYKNYINNNLYYVSFFHNAKLISMDSGSIEDWFEVIPIWIPPGFIVWKFVLDLVPEGTGIENEQYNWLVNRLVEYPEFNQIVFMHNPIVCCYDSHNYDEDCWNGCITKNRGKIMNRLRDPNNDGGFDDSAKLVLGGHVHTYYEYEVDTTNTPSLLSIPHGGYISTNDLEFLPMYVIGSAAGEDMAYRNISIHGDEIKVYSTTYLESTVKYEMDWIPWFIGYSRADGNGNDIEPAGRLHLYDSNGNHVGINDTGGIDFEIPGAYYAERFMYNQTGKYNWTTGEVISITSSRSDCEYIIETIDDATLNVTAQYALENGAWVKLSYLNITAYNGSVGKVFINNRPYNFTIYWDDDGDGIVDREIEPTNVTTNPPEKPARPDGPTSGKPGVEYTYTTSTTDLNGDQIYYLWDWGDGTFSDWLGPYESSETAEANHAWTEQGSYGIRVKAKDVYDCESEWSDPLPVTMPINQPSHNQQNSQSVESQQSTNPLFLQVLKRFVNHFPSLERILKSGLVSTNP